MTKLIAFVVFDGMKMLDLAGPAEVFAEAQLHGADYALTYVSTTGRRVHASNGTTMQVDGSTAHLGAVDTAIVCGGDVLTSAPIPGALVDAVRDLHHRARRTVSICTGSFVLADAGLLAGKRATTHWRHAPLMGRAYPDVAVEVDALFVEDHGVYTSAGVSAGIDLALALVEQDHGADLARQVARSLVVFMQRPGGQSQFSAPLSIDPPRTPELRRALDLIVAQPSLAHSVVSIADQVGVSPRHLSRLFADELGTSPARFVESARLDHAQALLDAGHSVSVTSRMVGFGSTETMRRRFISRLGVSPSQYRARFATTELRSP